MSFRTKTCSTIHFGEMPLLSCPILIVVKIPRFLCYMPTIQLRNITITHVYKEVWAIITTTNPASLNLCSSMNSRYLRATGPEPDTIGSETHCASTVVINRLYDDRITRWNEQTWRWHELSDGRIQFHGFTVVDLANMQWVWMQHILTHIDILIFLKPDGFYGDTPHWARLISEPFGVTWSRFYTNKMLFKAQMNSPTKHYHWSLSQYPVHIRQQLPAVSSYLNGNI